MTPAELITRVRERLGENVLPQSPSPLQILRRGVDEYQNATIRGNNTGNAWAVSEFVLTTQSDTRRYAIEVPDFSKALLVSTVPNYASTYKGERLLNFTQIEQIPNDWSWLSENAGGWYGLWSGSLGGRATYVAFYRQTAGFDGFKNFMEIRPTPGDGEDYRILYQVGDWSKSMGSDLGFEFPFSDVNFYFTTLVADGLLPYAKWSNNAAEDMEMRKMLKMAFTEDLQRYEQTFRDFIASLSVTGIVWGESYADFVGL